MCHQTVSLAARVLEEGGIPTVVFSNARDINLSAFTPRTVFTNYPLGNPVGRPDDRTNQREILGTGLRLLEEATQAGAILDTPHVWSEDKNWMRLIFSDEQPFLSEEGESRRQEILAKARDQKTAG